MRLQLKLSWIITDCIHCILYIYITKLLTFGYTNKLFFVCHTTLMKCARVTFSSRQGSKNCTYVSRSLLPEQSVSQWSYLFLLLGLTSVTIFKHFNHKILPFWEAVLSVHLKTSSSCTAPRLWQAKPSCYIACFSWNTAHTNSSYVTWPCVETFSSSWEQLLCTCKHLTPF